MKKPLLNIFFSFSLVICSASQATATERSVRLGGKIIEPGVSKLELVKSAGKPYQKETLGINMVTGDIKEVWYYTYANKNVAIYLQGAKVVKIAFAY